MCSSLSSQSAVGCATALAAAPETFGAILAALPELEELGEELGNSLIQDLEQFVNGKAIESASKPLEAKVKAMLQGLDWSIATGGVEPIGSGSVQLEMGMVEQHVGVLRQHEETMRSPLRHPPGASLDVRRLMREVPPRPCGMPAPCPPTSPAGDELDTTRYPTMLMARTSQGDEPATNPELDSRKAVDSCRRAVSQA